MHACAISHHRQLIRFLQEDFRFVVVLLDFATDLHVLSLEPG